MNALSSTSNLVTTFWISTFGGLLKGDMVALTTEKFCGLRVIFGDGLGGGLKKFNSEPLFIAECGPNWPMLIHERFKVDWFLVFDFDHGRLSSLSV